MIRAAVMMALAAGALAQTAPPKPAPAAHKPAVAGGLPNYSDLKYPELRAIASPAAQNFTLPNGMRVLLLENHELPLINGTVLVRTGSAFDPPEKIGLAALTAQLILEGGNGRIPGDDLTRRFEDLGAEIEGTVTESNLSISFSALKDNADTALDLLKSGITAPEFAQDRIDLVKVHTRNVIAHRNDDAPTILRREFVTAVYGKSSPYGAQMQNPDLDRINRADMVGFHQRYFFPGNLIFALEGDFDPAAMKSRIEGLFNDWKAEQSAVGDFPKVGGAAGGQKFLAVKKNLTQSFFAMGQVVGGVQDKDDPALEILCGILAGGPQSRLGRRLLGKVDDPSANWSPALGHPGLFKVSGTVASPFFTSQVLQAVTEELSRLRAEEVSDQELKTARNAVVNRLVFAFDNQLSILPRLALYAYFNLPADYPQQHQKALENVTRADVLHAARERLDPANMITVVVGNPTAFEAPLVSTGGAAIPIDLTIPPPKPEPAPGDAATERRGKDLLARAQQAMGGADKLAAVSDYVSHIAYQFDASAGGLKTTMTERWLAPGYLRQDNVTPSGTFSVYCNGKIGWIANPQGSNGLDATALRQVQGDLFHILFPFLLSDRANRRINALDDRTVEISDDTGLIAKAVFDPATGLLKDLFYDVATVNGPTPVIESYADYREVNGLKLPFQTAITVSGKKFQDLTISSIELNTGLKVEDLEKRP